ncbi:DUF305 domain-containing protein [Nocardioides sp. SYSU DS0663]|uniref:DUF305 domain-containing protein n=1 Tax=Nocardioides sp. SYSU DS0663 TaxID=3416445 RepID=UPI003F4B6EA0
MDDQSHAHHGADHGADHGDDRDAAMKKKHERRMYLRFAAMIATSTAVMFVLTYSNTYQFEHIHYSQERLYMALLMGAAMAMVMLSFMVSMMYKSRALNAVVVVTAIALFGAAYTASRTQLFVDDERYMKAMVPHHSIAILTSERADIDDVRVRQLADEIIRTQRLEIKEMEWLLEDIEEHGLATTDEEAAERPIPDFEASAGASLARADAAAREVQLLEALRHLVAGG